MGDIRRKIRIFPVGVPEISRFFSRISRDPADGVIITGVSALIFNTRRFRPPFSSYAFTEIQ